MARLPSPSDHDPFPEDAKQLKEREAKRMARRPWAPFTSPEGFSVRMPSPVSAIAPGMYSASSEGIAYEITVSPRKAPPFSPPPDNSLLLAYLALGTAEALLGSFSRGGDRMAEVTFVGAQNLGAYPGSAYRITATGYCGDNNESGAFRVYMTDKYFVALMALDATEDDPRVREFFDSLSVGGT